MTGINRILVAPCIAEIVPAAISSAAGVQNRQRYINGSSKVLLFVREFNKVGNVSQPFVCLGTARYVSHTGSKPMSIVWRPGAEIPAGVMRMAGKGM